MCVPGGRLLIVPDRPASEFRVERRVAFSDTDAAGIAHFSSYYVYMEDVEHEFLRAVGLGVDVPQGEWRLGFPRLAARCEFRRPLRFEDVVAIELRVQRIGRKSLTYQFLFSRDGEEVARGEVSTSCCRCYPDGRIESTPVPNSFRDRIAESTQELLEFGRR